MSCTFLLFIRNLKTIGRYRCGSHLWVRTGTREVQQGMIVVRSEVVVTLGLLHTWSQWTCIISVFCLESVNDICEVLPERYYVSQDTLSGHWLHIWVTILCCSYSCLQGTSPPAWGHITSSTRAHHLRAHHITSSTRHITHLHLFHKHHAGHKFHEIDLLCQFGQSFIAVIWGIRLPAWSWWLRLQGISSSFARFIRCDL